MMAAFDDPATKYFWVRTLRPISESSSPCTSWHKALSSSVPQTQRWSPAADFWPGQLRDQHAGLQGQLDLCGGQRHQDKDPIRAGNTSPGWHTTKSITHRRRKAPCFCFCFHCVRGTCFSSAACRWRHLTPRTWDPWQDFRLCLESAPAGLTTITWETWNIIAADVFCPSTVFLCLPV